MTVFIKKENESFLKIITRDDNILTQIYHYFSFYVEKYQFMPSYKSEMWDGKIHLFDISTHLLPIGMLNSLIQFLKKNEIDFRLSKNVNEKVKIEKKDIIKFIKNENEKRNIKIKFYQLKGLILSLTDNKSIIQSPTASGKSYIIFLFIKYLIDHILKKEDKILLIVVKKSLAYQMRDEFVNYDETFSKHIHVIIGGIEKTNEKQIHISTWQSVYKQNINHFRQYKTLIIDECHHAKADSIRRITECCIHAVFRLGTTATINNNNYKFILQGNFGNIYNIEKTKKLIKKKILSNVMIYHLILKHPLETKILVNSFEVRNINREIRIALENKKRYKIILNTISGLNKNSLVLFKRISFGKKIYNDLKELINKPVYYIDGQTKIKEREKIRKRLENENNSILIATDKIFSTGINIKNLHYIIITVFNKSKIAVMQTIGRGLRLHETKDKARIIDFVDDMQLTSREKKENETKTMKLNTRRNLLLQHFYDRIKIYKEEGFEYKIKRLTL